jgi:16S rRNA (cytosine967-C5)-methyltransferase
VSAAPSARAAALALLDRILNRRQPLDEALAAEALLDRLSARDRAFAHRLVLTVLRRLGQIDAVLASYMARPLPKRRATVRNLLRLGAAQLLFMDTPAHAAVDTTATLATECALPAFVALTNAVLRRVATDGRALIASQDAAALNTPAWLWTELISPYGEATTRAIARAHALEPPLDLTCRQDASAWATKLAGTLLPTGSVRLVGRPAVESLPGYEEGAWWVQDAAAALPARLLGSLADKLVIEIGAAPGGKTAQLLAQGARVSALDRSPTRLAKLRDNLARLGFEATLVEADATVWQAPEPADAILLDAPCSATGTIRRHPDVPYVRAPEDVERMTAIQDALLAAAARMVKPGGIVVFATCSLLPLEGEARIDAALSSGLGLAREPVTPELIGGDLGVLINRRGELRTLPCHLTDQGGMDGFFAARLRRMA